MKITKKIVSLLMMSIFLCSLNASAARTSQTPTNDENNSTNIINQFVQTSLNGDEGDIDPLVDLEVTVTIKEIRALKKIDDIGKADFSVDLYLKYKKKGAGFLLRSRTPFLKFYS